MKSGSCRRTIVCLLAILLLAMPFVPISGPAGAATVIDKLGGGSSEAILTYTGAGEDTSLYLTVPKMATVNSASMTFEGDSLRALTPQTIDFDFNDTTSNGGWTGNTANNISSSQNGPNSWQAGAIPVGDLSKLASSDDDRYETITKGAAYSYQQFKFTVQMAEISQIDVFWEGNGEWYDITGVSGKIMKGAQVFLWNNGSAQWEYVGHYDIDNGREDERLSKSFTGSLDGYLFNDIELRVVVSTYHGNGVMGVPTLNTDFVKVTVTGKPLEWPTDLALDLADDGSVEWSYPGQLMGPETFSGVDLTAALQALINDEGAGHGDFDITLSLTSASGGKLTVKAININVNEYVNQPPALTDITGNFRLSEDTDAPGLIDLRDYFADDIDVDADLVFALENESDPDHLHAEITTDGLMGFTTPTDHWFGSASFIVSATDTDLAKTVSNEFTVHVDPVDDPPVLAAVGPMTFSENEQSTIILKATDPDKLFGGTDTLTYGVTFLQGSPFFNLNSGTGAAHFIPNDANVGTYSVNFSVMDSKGLMDSEIVQLTVQDVNNPPEIDDSSTTKTLDEDTEFEDTLEATDIDASDQGELRFSAEFLEGTTLFDVDPSGYYNWTPRQEHVGTHRVKFTVTDSGGMKDSMTVQFEVRNVNDAPVIDQLEDLTINRNAPFSLQVTAMDEDIGYVQAEYLEFSDNTKLFDIDPDTGWMNFTPTTDQVGEYTVTITCKDLADATATMRFNIEVVHNNTAPVAKIFTQDNKTKFVEGRAIMLTADATDADNDEMTFKWLERSKKDVELGTDAEVTVKGLKPGKHTIVLQVSDGVETTEVQTEIKVTADGAGTPGFEAWVLVLSIVAVLFWSRRRRAWTGE